MHDIVKARLSDIFGAASSGAPKLTRSELCAYYTFDKKEAPDRSWPLVVRVLEHLGFEGLDADDNSSRSATIPPELCTQFQSRVVEPWQEAWRAFRSSQRSRGGPAGERNHKTPQTYHFLTQTRPPYTVLVDKHKPPVSNENTPLSTANRRRRLRRRFSDLCRRGGRRKWRGALW